MKTIKTYLSLLLFLIFVSAGCANQEEKLPSVEVNGTEIPDLDPDLLEPIDIKLSWIADNLHVVMIEDNENCQLSKDASFLIGDDYIIVCDRKFIYQFSSSGKYIRKLVTHGRGPEEIPEAFPKCSLVEDKNLFIAFSSDKIYMYDLSTGLLINDEWRLGLLPGQNLRNVKYVGNSIFLFSYEQSGTSTYEVPINSTYCGVRLQNFDGRIIWEREFNYKSWVIYAVRNMKVLNGSTINIISTDLPEEFVLQVFDHDTTYRLNIGSFLVEPVLMERIEKLKLEGYPIDRRADNCTIEYEESTSVNGYRFINYNLLIDDKSTLGDRYFILYDMNKESAFRIGIFENDFLGFYHDTKGDMGSKHNFPFLSEPSHKLIEIYDAFTFLQFASEALENPDLDPIVRTRLLDLTDKVTETSNPVLLIGDMKKKIDL